MTADVYIGNQAFTVDDDTRTLVHDRCGKRLFGDGAIASHICRGVCIHCGLPVWWAEFYGYRPGAWVTDQDERSTEHCDGSDDNRHAVEVAS